MRGSTRAVVLVCMIVVTLAVLGAGGWWLAHTYEHGPVAQDEDERSPKWAVVRSESISVKIVADGNLMAKHQINIVNTVETYGNISIESLVEEGKWVSEGDWLFTMSAPSLVIDRDQWESMVRDAGAKLEEARRNLEIEKDTKASEEAAARLTLELAELAHKRWELGEHALRLLELQLAVDKAVRTLDQTQRELKYSKELFAKEFISRSELEQDEIALIEAESELKSAKLNLEVYEKYEKVMSEKEKLSDISQAKEELGRTIRKSRNALELLQSQVLSSQDGLKQVTARYEQLRKMVDALEVRAPGRGMVIYSSTLMGGRNQWYTIRAGARPYPGQLIMVLSNTAQMVANLYVHESRINEIEVGQLVSVKVNASEEVFEGKVIEKKNSAIQSAGGNPHLREYQVLIELPPNLGDDIRPGMNCSGEIFIRKIAKTLTVPVQAVHTEGTEHFVYVEADGGKVRRQPIEMGGASETLVQVLSGLDAGTRVLLRNPMPGEVQRGESPEPASPVAEQGGGSSENT